VDDLVEATLLGALDGKPGRAYTAWSGEDVTFREYFERLAALAGGRCRVLPAAVLQAASSVSSAAARARGVPPELGPHALTFVDRRGNVATARIRDELGWKPRVSLDEGLERIRSWMTDPRPPIPGSRPPRHLPGRPHRMPAPCQAVATARSRSSFPPPP
jgi:nucleoside-diphosphate-sugar epimerase